MNLADNMKFFKGKNIFITGHTGFKGSWLSWILIKLGANVTGYSLEPQTEYSLFNICRLSNHMTSIIGDIRDFENLKKSLDEVRPELVFHLAAQPIVREGYTNPRYTYETNVMGTVNILECIKENNCVKSFINITTDKVYENKEWEWGYREIDNLDGFDPYSNSKSCSELITHSYKSSFFSKSGAASISSARAGNVIGGGDFSNDRIIPDCIRAMIKKESINVRNPYSIRPYQHVLEPLFAYLMIVEKQYKNKRYSGWYNIGPDYRDCISTGELVDIFCDIWNENSDWINLKEINAPHEAGLLRLDCSKIKSVFGWKPTWNVYNSVEKTIEWTKVWINKGDVAEEMNREIEVFMDDMNKCNVNN